MMGKARYVAAAACAALLAAGAGACGTSVSVVTEGAAQGPTIAIGVAADQPGLGYLHGGEYSGFDIDVAKYVAKTLGYAEKQIVFKQLSPAMRASALTDGTVDMVVDSFSMDGTHDGEADVAGPYLTVREALLIRSDSASEITGTDSLSDKTVCAVAGSAADDNIRNRTKNTRTTVAERDTYPQCMTALMIGEADAVAADDAIAAGLGMVHQHFMLIQPFTVTENIILGMEPTKGLTVDKETAKKKVLELSERYGMKVDPDAKVEDISVGMQQRVEILKVLYRGADILILDEPTASLTPQEITELMEIISNLTADGKSVILITHKLKEITSCADYCTIIRQGKYIDTVKVSDVNENDLAAMMVGRKVEFKVEKKDIKPGEVVLEVKDIHGDKQFFLNGKRIVLRTAISWSFWPDNGITPSDELARRQVESAKKLGLNMLNFHRTIGHSNVLDYADELGLLYFEEPGGNQYPISHFNDNNKQSKFYFAYRNEKLVRMIKRDRNHPSLVIYNLHNERGAWPQVQDYAQMRMAHSLDPTRILTYNSSNGENPENEANARFKLHLMPNDTTFYDYGWYDRHHAGGPGCYHDNLYWGKDNYHRFSDHKDEIIYWGEDGAIGTPPRLQLIRDEILQSGTTSGWEAMDYMKWYDAYDSFLKHNGFAKAISYSG